jgi:hypothetical protein
VLIVYRIADGVIVDNTGTSSAWPWPHDPAELVDPPAPVRSEDEEYDAWQVRLDEHAAELAAIAAERDQRTAVLEDVITANLGDTPRADVDYLRLHDDSPAAQATFTHRCTVDVDARELVVGAAFPTLTVEPRVIPADGQTPAVVTYRDEDAGAPAEVIVTVDGTEHPVELIDGVAALEVVADTPGVVTITFDGSTVTVEATP